MLLRNYRRHRLVLPSASFACLLWALPGIYAQSGPPNAVASVALTSSTSQSPSGGTNAQIAFLTDRIVAVGMCSGQRCALSTYLLSEGELRKVDESAAFVPYTHLFRSADGGVLEDHVWIERTKGAAVLFAPDLLTHQLLPDIWVGLNQISPTGETFIMNERSGNGWAAYKTAATDTPFLKGEGRGLALSNDKVAYLESGSIRLESADGKLLGSFPIKTGCSPNSARILGEDRFWLSGCGNDQILDFHGKTLIKLPHRDGWGETRQSTDGRRLLYHSYTRHVSPIQSAGEIALAVATMGVGVDDQAPNGETVRVIDTTTGKSCFELRGTTGLVGTGTSHSDLDPTGRRVAVVTRNSLSVYTVPDSCKGQ
jgi:hypothetical protein